MVMRGQLVMHDRLRGVRVHIFNLHHVEDHHHMTLMDDHHQVLIADHLDHLIRIQIVEGVLEALETDLVIIDHPI
jgi:hypothetical protein